MDVIDKLQFFNDDDHAGIRASVEQIYQKLLVNWSGPNKDAFELKINQLFEAQKPFIKWYSNQFMHKILSYAEQEKDREKVE